MWSRYEIATGISKQDSLVRVSTFLSVIDEDATKAFDAFEWGEAEDETNIEHVLAKLDAYCEPHRLYTSVTDLTIANRGPARTSQRISQS